MSNFQDASTEKVTPLDFVRARNIRLITVIVSLAWFCVAAVAFGFTFNVGKYVDGFWRRWYFLLALAWEDKASGLPYIVSYVCEPINHRSLISGPFLDAGNMTGNIFINMYIVMAGGIFNLASIWVIKFGRRLLITIGFYSAAILAAILAILVSYKHLEGELKTGLTQCRYWHGICYSKKYLHSF